MVKVHDQEFKAVSVELLKSARKVQEVNAEYCFNGSMLSRWRREYEAK